MEVWDPEAVSRRLQAAADTAERCLRHCESKAHSIPIHQPLHDHNRAGRSTEARGTRQVEKPALRRAFTLIELLVVIAVIALLAALLFPVLSNARRKGQQSACRSNMRQISLASWLYMNDYNGGLYHHHEGWVLDDGSQVDTLPTDLSGVAGGGKSRTQVEKPWVIFFQPYLHSRTVAFCPADRTPRSQVLATDLTGYNGAITTTDQAPPSDSEQAIAEAQNLTIESYVLNSVFTHKSARYALEGVLTGFATETEISRMPNPNFIMFSERNSEALDAFDNIDYGRVDKDDYDTWVGEAALVRWGSGSYSDQGWIRYNRHGKSSNYIYTDGHVENLKWSSARQDQFPDHVVRSPLADPPQPE